MALKAGDKAPDFTLPDTTKQLVTLSSLRGENVLLLFFPLAFTSVCTKELCSVRDNLATYNNANVRVLGISVDSPYSLARFREEQGLNFTLLSDFNKTVSTDYGCLYETFSLGLKGVSKRSAFLIDSGGTIRYAEVLENAGEVPDFDAIQAAMAEIG